MITVYTAISDLLFLHDAVVVPGLGKFQCQNQGAQVNVITNQFVRPTVTVAFEPGSEEDKALVSYLCEQNQLAENEAESMLTQFVAELNKALQEGEEISFPEIGALSVSQAGEFSFKQTESLLTEGDAFGLGDFTPTPVFTSEAQNDWRKRLAEEQWDKNTKMTVDKEVMYVENQEELEALRHRRRKRIRRAILFSCLGLLAVLAFLVYLKVIKIDFVMRYFNTQPEPPVVEKVDFHPNPELLAEMVSYYPLPAPEQQVEEVVVEPEEDAVEATLDRPAEWDENHAPSPTSKYFIVGGFFSEKQNATNLAKSLFEQGYVEAFIYPAGSKYYTCYGHYETKEEAKQALEEVKAGNPKAWLYERKR